MPPWFWHSLQMSAKVRDIPRESTLALRKSLTIGLRYDRAWTGDGQRLCKGKPLLSFWVATRRFANDGDRALGQLLRHDAEMVRPWTQSPIYQRYVWPYEVNIEMKTHIFLGPLCNSSAPDSKPVDTVSYIDGYTTSVFISQLLSSFNNTDAFAYVCNHIGFNMVSSFAINDLTVVQAVCAAAGLQTKLRPEKSLPWASDGAVRAARNTASILFTIIWAAGATSDSQLNAACARAPDYVSYLDMEQLNGTLVQSTLCSIKTPIAASHARDALKTWMSRYFTTVLENIIHGEGWLEWLCKNIDPDMLDLAGLFGAGIQSQVCADSKSYPASDGRWERTHLNQGHFEPGEHSRRYFDIF